MKRILLFAIIILCAASVSPGLASHRGGVSTSATCPSSYNDGCAGANPNGAFINTSALTAFQQSGQSSILPTHPQPFNISGVDYPVAYDTTLVLKDPSVTQPANCTYNATGNASGGPLMTCNSGSAAITVDGYDFASKCAVLSLSGATTALTTITNNKFKRGSSCNTAMIGKTSNAPIKLWNNLYDDNWQALGGGQFFLSDSSSGTTPTIDMEYNAFLNMGSSRIYGGPRGFASRTFKYNYLDSLGLGNTAHGEVDLFGGQNTNLSPIPAVEWSFNFMGLQQGPPTQIDTILYMSTGALNSVSSANSTITGNTVITNKDNVGAVTDGNGLWVGGWAALGNFTFTDNYFDPTGSFSCLLNGRFNQNSTASASGNTLTITVDANLGNRIMVGSIIFHNGVFFAFITAQTGGTSMGSGTYTFDGAPQTAGSSNGWKIAPGYTNLTVARNVNLTDGSAITFPEPVGDGQACNNHG